MLVENSLNVLRRRYRPEASWSVNSDSHCCCRVQVCSHCREGENGLLFLGEAETLYYTKYILSIIVCQWLKLFLRKYLYFKITFYQLVTKWKDLEKRITKYMCPTDEDHEGPLPEMDMQCTVYSAESLLSIFRYDWGFGTTAGCADCAEWAWFSQAAAVHANSCGFLLSSGPLKDHYASNQQAAIIQYTITRENPS